MDLNEASEIYMEASRECREDMNELIEYLKEESVGFRILHHSAYGFTFLFWFVVGCALYSGNDAAVYGLLCFAFVFQVMMFLAHLLRRSGSEDL
jgi:hypothetical protein